MLRDGAIGGNEMAWSGDSARQSWQDIDRALRELARRRGALDAEEAQLLCLVVQREIWRALGKASLLEYLEEVLGYSPRAAKERVRVALALQELPELADALAMGELAFSAIRELTRVATPATQKAWCDAARGRNLRQIEQDVPPRIRRFVKLRDGKKCCVPACRAAKHVEIHHVVPISQGGSHEPENLTLLCDGHHRALHEGKLTIVGKAPRLDVQWTRQHEPPAVTHVGQHESRSAPPPEVSHDVPHSSVMEPAGARLAQARLKEQAKHALVTLRFSKTEASAAIDAALTHVGRDPTLEQLLFEALRRCPRPCR